MWLRWLSGLVLQRNYLLLFERGNLFEYQLSVLITTLVDLPISAACLLNSMSPNLILIPQFIIKTFAEREPSLLIVTLVDLCPAQILR
jgi:hypothetical protein